MSAPAQKERPRPATTTARDLVHASPSRSSAAVERVRQSRGSSALRACGRSRVSRATGALRGQAGGGRVGHERSRFATISRMISEVPEAIVHRRTSRKKRSTGNSRM